MKLQLTTQWGCRRPFHCADFVPGSGLYSGMRTGVLAGRPWNSPSWFSPLPAGTTGSHRGQNRSVGSPCHLSQISKVQGQSTQPFVVVSTANHLCSISPYHLPSPANQVHATRSTRISCERIPDYLRFDPLRPINKDMVSAETAQEEGCIATTFERKYYHLGGVFIKRNLRSREFRTGYRGLYVPRLGKERLLNEAEALQFVRQHTDIPVPAVNCHFEDDEAYYLITEYIEGVSMSELSEKQKVVVRQELEIHREKLKTLKSRRLGGPSGLVIPPYRVLNRAETDCWNLQPSSNEEYVFCHNDLSQQNIIVNPDTLKIRAIIDWEYAGFFPARFDYPFYNRLGPSSAINGEVDDSLELLQFLDSQESGSSQGGGGKIHCQAV